MRTDSTEQKTMYLFVKGLPEYEQRVVEATAKISHSRSLALHLVDEQQALSANIILLDGTNPTVRHWAKNNESWLKKRTVIWVDAKTDNPNHATLERPVMWVNLPITISRILDDIDIQQIGRARIKTQSTTIDTLSSFKLRVLICDDSQAVRNYLANFLEQKGYAVTAVESGELAVAQAKAKPFDCVLMDILMPGMDGYRACREIVRAKHGNKTTPVIMLTSKSSPFDKIRGKISGCKAYLTKPVTQSALLKTVAQHTKSGQ